MGSVKALQGELLPSESSGKHWNEKSEKSARRNAGRGTGKPPLTVLRSATGRWQRLVSPHQDSPADPCRGLDRNGPARIRAQKAPSVSPVGSGAEYHRRSG
jgi:hypothetical protein